MAVNRETTQQERLEAGRAQFAFRKVSELVRETENDKDKQKKYKSYTRRLGMLIKANGLAAAVAFAFSKASGGSPWETLYQHIEEWLQECNIMPRPAPGGQGGCGQTTLAEFLVGLPIPLYRLAENEVLAFLNWLKRFTEAMIEGEAND